MRTRAFKLPGVIAGSLAVTDGTVWVANGDYAGRVYKLDAHTARLLATIRLGGLASGVATSADAVWVSLANCSQVVRIDPKRSRIVARLPVGAGAFNLAVAAGRVWVANDGTVSEIDAHTNRVLRSAIQIGTRAAGIAATSDRIFVSDPDHNQVISFAPSTPNHQTRYHAPGHPIHLTVSDTQVWALGYHRLTAIQAR
jgi:DNA-binding beta-propeller fold protein YncE